MDITTSFLNGNHNINVEPLTEELFKKEKEQIKSFDCGRNLLNQFIKDKRKCIEHLKMHIAKTYLVYDGDIIVGYYCLSADAMRATDIIRSQFKSWKTYSTYPAVKIGRFAINQKVAKVGYGSSTMDYIKIQIALANMPISVRFLTVDAVNDEGTLYFYEKNNFIYLSKNDKNDETRLMYYDLNAVFN